VVAPRTLLALLVCSCGSSSAASTGSSDAASPPEDSALDASPGDASAGDSGPTLDAHADGPTPAKDASGADGSAPSCTVPFAASGPWCTPLPASPPLASNSAAVVANIQTDVKNNYGTFSINTDAYSSPIYTVPAGTPATNWSFDDCQNKGSLPPSFAPVLMNVPTELGMVQSMGTDGEITIYDPSADQEWEFWVASQTSGQWSACWGGTIQHVSTNPGIFPSGLGATASGLPLLGFVIRIDELQAGVIRHTINIETVRTQASVFSWPANRTDGNTADADILMEGQRVRLDPTFDVATLPNPAERIIAKAMQDYGMILTDTSGAVTMQAEDPRPYMAAHNTTTNPYDAIFAGTPSYSVLQDIPLSRLQVLAKDFGM
jgi:hypothetical protein